MHPNISIRFNLNFFLRSEVDSKPLLTAVVQFSKDPNNQLHPPILSFQVSEIRSSMDPLLTQWLQYSPVYYKLDQVIPQPEVQHQTPGEISPDPSVRKKNFPSISQSVHSSSDKEKRKSVITLDESNAVSKPDDLPKSEQKTETLSSQGVSIFSLCVKTYFQKQVPPNFTI